MAFAGGEVMRRGFPFRLGRRPSSGEAVRQKTAPDDGVPARGEMASLHASDVMSRSVPMVHEDTRLTAVASAMLEQNAGCVLVLDHEERLRGIITESDFTIKEGYLPFSPERLPQLFGEWVTKRDLGEAYARGRWLTAGEVMHSPVVTVGPRTPVADVIQLMLRRHVAHVPVLRDGAIEGVVSQHDLLKLVAQQPNSAPTAARTADLPPPP